ncbi:DUF4139 domain-containing protein, partial [Bacteroidota bacterium]
MKKSIAIVILLIIAIPSIQTNAQDNSIKSVNVTVYNDNLGVVKEIREINLKKGISDIKITGVAERIDPTSVHIKLNGTVLEQNYQYDLVSLHKILNKYIDSEIEMISDKELISGTLLSVSNKSVVVRKKDGGLLLLPDFNKYQFSVKSLPEGLITRPTLLWKVDSDKQGKQDIELSYQTGGMKWHAEYVAVLNDNDTKMDLNAWVSIMNNSGADYKNAKLKVVAGDVNRIAYDVRAIRVDGLMKREAEDSFEERAFFEYHIYDLQRPTTISHNEIKQISLFEAENISVSKKYIYRSSAYGNSGKVAVYLEFDNSKKNSLGMPFPAGKVRLNKRDGGSLEFIGEDMIEHTPKDEKIKLKAGDAFD